jgi:hypothetical protein
VFLTEQFSEPTFADPAQALSALANTNNKPFGNAMT